MSVGRILVLDGLVYTYLDFYNQYTSFGCQLCFNTLIETCGSLFAWQTTRPNFLRNNTWG
jgi:hypothetical protein